MVSFVRSCHKRGCNGNDFGDKADVEGGGWHENGKGNHTQWYVIHKDNIVEKNKIDWNSIMIILMVCGMMIY